ncbi:MAG: SDR family NAD(P)-dependent oxidoreductase [Bacteroidota bacterium]
MKTVIVTGGNSGIGKATATELARKGYRVIIHGRDAQKTMIALQDIIKQSGNSRVEAVTGDMSSVAGMKKVAESFRQKTDVVDILVLSTGIILSRRVETADGLEGAFAAQYLSRFATVQWLMPMLRKSPFARIVMVGAPTMKKAAIHFDDLSLRNNFSMMRSMGQCMLASHMFVQEFAKRHPNDNVVMNIFHVGIAKTGVVREVNVVFRGLVKLFGASPEKACANAVYLADNDEVKFSGYFLPKPGKPHVKEKIQYDHAISERLWNTSMELIEPVKEMAV